jgi:hypothetical protein
MTTRVTREYVEQVGFTGFVTVRVLRASRCREVPTDAGVYVVIRATEEAPEFLTRSVGGWFKRKDPTVDVEWLTKRWLINTPVLYLGMAGSNLRVRVRALVDYGGGRPVGHQGGRYLWQVEGSADFLVGWRVDPDARRLESGLLADFQAAHGRLPFANLSH